MHGFIWILALTLAPARAAEPDRESPVDAQAVRRAVERIQKSSKQEPSQAKTLPGEAELGKQLFFDPRISKNGALSCATCHQPSLAFSDGLPRARGLNQRELRRRTPSLLHLRYMQHGQFFWDGRAHSVAEATLAAILNPEEMAQDLPGLTRSLSAIPAYTRRFRELYGMEPSGPLVGRAIAAFLAEISAQPDESPFDRMLSDPTAMTPAAQRGLLLAVNKAQCIRCHSGPAWSDGAFHNTGLKTSSSNPDPGRWAIEASVHMKGAFRTPSLRGAGLRAPYMHDGSLATLREVVEFYDRGGDGEPLARDFDIFPLGLTPAEKDDLVAFLRSLDGTPPRVELPLLPANGGPDSLSEGFEWSRLALAELASLAKDRDPAVVRARASMLQEHVRRMGAMTAGGGASLRGCLKELDLACRALTASKAAPPPLSERLERISAEVRRCEDAWLAEQRPPGSSRALKGAEQDSALLKTWQASPTEIAAVLFLDGGKKTLVAGREKSVGVWDVASGRNLAYWTSNGSHNGIAVSPDGRKVLVGSDDKKVYFYDSEGTLLAKGEGHTASVNALAFSPDGRRAVTSGDDTMIRVWDADSSKPLSVWAGHGGSVRVLRYTPDGSKVLSASHDSTIRVWDAASGAPLAVWKGHEGRVFSLVMTPDGRRAFTGGDDGLIKVWEVATGTLLSTWKVGPLVGCLDISPDGQRLLACSGEQVEVRDADSGKKLAAWKGHSATVFTVAFSPDGRKVLSAGWDGTLNLWDSSR